MTLIVIAATGGQAFTFAKKATTRIDARSATAPFVQLLRPNSSIGSVVRFDDDLGTNKGAAPCATREHVGWSASVLIVVAYERSWRIVFPPSAEAP